MERSIRWLDRSISANVHENAPHPHTGKHQLLFAIIQGGLQPDLRTRSLDMILERRAHLGGIAIGGLSGGEAKEDFWRTVAHCTARLPPNYVRYCMGVGYPEDLVTCVALGVDLFDCVYPCRTARFGTALTSRGRLQTRAAAMRYDFRPIDPDCDCRVCTGYTRAYFAAVIPRSPVGGALLSYHNLYYLIHLMGRARAALKEGPAAFHAFVNDFLRKQFVIDADGADDKDRRVPSWIVEAMEAAKVPLDADVLGKA